MGTVLYIRRRKLTKNSLEQEPKKSETAKTNVIPLPIMERKAKMCQNCGLPFFEDICPDCGPESDQT